MTARLPRILALVVMVCAVCAAGHATTRTVLMEWRPRVDCPVTLNWETRKDVPFRLEPELGNRDVGRGYMQFDTDGLMPFLYDYDRNILMIDVNRDGNIMDDAPMQFDPKAEEAAQTFDLMLTGTATRRYRIRTEGLQRRSRIKMASCRARIPTFLVESGWVAEVELDGRRYEIQFCDDTVPGSVGKDCMDRIRFRPVPVEGSTTETLWEGSASPRLGEGIFLGSREYHFEFAFVDDSETSAMEVRIREHAPRVVPVTLVGEHIRGVHLAGKINDSLAPVTHVILYGTTGSVNIPVAFYRDVVTELEYTPGIGIPVRWQDVICPLVDERGTTLVVGAPLKPSLSVQSYGRTLSIGFSFHNSVGQKASLSLPEPADDASSRPVVIISKNGEVIERGNFRYG